MSRKKNKPLMNSATQNHIVDLLSTKRMKHLSCNVVVQLVFQVTVTLLNSKFRERVCVNPIFSLRKFSLTVTEPSRSSV